MHTHAIITNKKYPNYKVLSMHNYYNYNVTGSITMISLLSRTEMTLFAYITTIYDYNVIIVY